MLVPGPATWAALSKRSPLWFSIFTANNSTPQKRGLQLVLLAECCLDNFFSFILITEDRHRWHSRSSSLAKLPLQFSPSGCRWAAGADCDSITCCGLTCAWEESQAFCMPEWLRGIRGQVRHRGTDTLSLSQGPIRKSLSLRTMFRRFSAECAVSHSAEFNHGIVSSALSAAVLSWAADWGCSSFHAVRMQKDEVNVQRQRSSGGDRSRGK